MKYLKKYGALALCLALLAIPLLLAAPEVSASEVSYSCHTRVYFVDEPEVFAGTYTEAKNAGYIFTLNSSFLSIGPYYADEILTYNSCIYVNSSVGDDRILIYDGVNKTWANENLKNAYFTFSVTFPDAFADWFLSIVESTSFTFSVYPAGAYSSLFEAECFGSYSVEVTDSGCIVSVPGYDPQVYTYSGTDIFLGFANSAYSSNVAYSPGQTYEFSAPVQFWLLVDEVPVYEASFYDISGSFVGSTGMSYSPLTLEVTSSGATITLADGEPLTYTYSGTEIFAGFATSASGSATYTPGNTYTLNASSSLYAKETARPTYAASFYSLIGTLISSTSTSYSPLTLQVTSTGAIITLADGESLTYTYTGSEIFAGFATGASGSVVYSPGKTYTLSATSTKLYAKESPRPTYTVNLFDVGSSELLANATSYEYISMKVTSSGAVFSSMGETFEYAYSGSEIFAGFASASGGIAEYVPGKTYVLSASSTSLYALETPRPVYTITLYDTSGAVVVGPLKSYSPISFRITGNVAKFVTAEDQIITWTYEGDKQFLGFALDQDAEDPAYRAGITFAPKNYDVILYVVDKVIDLGAAGDILDVFSALSAFFINMLVTATGAFWSAETGLTFLGALLVITSGFVTVFLIVWIVLAWIKNKR